MPVSQFIIAFWIALSSALPLEGEQTTTSLPRGLCKGPTGDPMVCDDRFPRVPTNTVEYNCVPPLHDAAGHKQIYTFIDPTHEQMAVNRLIEKAMGRGECDSLHYWLQSIYSDYGSYLASDYPLPMYSPSLRAENEANPLKCEVRCIDATDPDTVSYCNAKDCGTVSELLRQ